jgi:DNA-binding MarR family transcriptional regulator
MSQTDEVTERGRPHGGRLRSLTVEGCRALRRMPDLDAESATIGLTLTRAAHAHASASEALVHRRHDRNWLVFNVLYVVWAFEPVSARDVVEWMGMSRQTISNILRALEAKGVITRARDTEDARLMTIRLTEEGRASVERSITEQFELDSAVFSALTEEERDQLASLLDRVRLRVMALEEERPRSLDNDADR